MDGLGKRQNYYFTFACNSENRDKIAKAFGNYFEAREKMLKAFGTKFAFQYNEEEYCNEVQRYYRGAEIIDLG